MSLVRLGYVVIIVALLAPDAMAEVPHDGDVVGAAGPLTAAAQPQESVTVVPEPVAAPAAPPKPVVTLVAQVDLAHQRMIVSINGKVAHAWPISSGTREFPTPTGNFRPEWMAKLWHSQKYDLAPMPHAVFFKEGAAIHATGATGALGRPASHGCVRLAPSNAEMFYKLVGRHGRDSTRIVVKGQPKFAPVAVAQRNPPDRVYAYAAAAPGYGYGYGSETRYAPASVNNSPFASPRRAPLAMPASRPH